jgi:hypothetical protein
MMTCENMFQENLTGAHPSIQIEENTLGHIEYRSHIIQTDANAAAMMYLGLRNVKYGYFT